MLKQRMECRTEPGRNGVRFRNEADRGDGQTGSESRRSGIHDQVGWAQAWIAQNDADVGTRRVALMLEAHCDESFWREGADVVRLHDGGKHIVGHHYDEDDDVSTLPCDTWLACV